MGERKVLNKYFPWDFDPEKVPRRKIDRDAAVEVRMMLPFNMCCLTCGHYMYRGKKFNSTKETAKGEDYLGIRIFRFRIKCEACKAAITFKTDPENGDYTCESGASRNFETWRETGDDANKELIKQPKEIEKDALETLEKRTLESKREMDTLDALDELQTLSKTRNKISTDDVIQRIQKEEKQVEMTEEEVLKLAQKAFKEKRNFVRRIDNSKPSATTSKESLEKNGKNEKPLDTLLESNNVVITKKRKKSKIGEVAKKQKSASVQVESQGLNALIGYSSSSSED